VLLRAFLRGKAKGSSSILFLRRRFLKERPTPREEPSIRVRGPMGFFQESDPSRRGSPSAGVLFGERSFFKRLSHPEDFPFFFYELSFSRSRPDSVLRTFLLTPPSREGLERTKTICRGCLPRSRKSPLWKIRRKSIETPPLKRNFLNGGLYFDLRSSL